MRSLLLLAIKRALELAYNRSNTMRFKGDYKQVARGLGEVLKA